ncbi:MAG: tripartite tricarboxylate transporter substrate-binding protein [Marinobacter sp.]|uniref:Bug family tripartite tricarboxylate transporter substrate binding protein n=1 Tax=Marinobacter sp. TaxID=50741 RepID=UPI0034A0A21E
MKIPVLSSLFLSAVVGLTSFTATAQDQTPAEFYGGKTIELMVGYSAGGGYDTYARTVARHLGKHVPGNPDVIVKNVPGAGSLVLMNQLANTLPKDGSVIGSINSGMPFEPLFGNEKAKFDIETMNWIGNVLVATTVGVVHEDAGVNSWQDLRTKSVTMGATGAGSNTNVVPRIMAKIFDLKIDVIAGYPGANDIVLAMERGEVDGLGSRFMSSLKSSTPEWLEPDSKIKILYQIARKKHPDLPNVPLVSEMAETETQRQAANLLGARLVMGRPYVAPPGVPADRMAALRKALEDTSKDPEFLADAAKQSLAIEYANDQEMLDFYRDVYKAPPEVIEFVESAVN